MADKIDKSLTQGPRGSVTVPGEEQIQEDVIQEISTEQQAPGPVETTELEDGSVQIDFDPQANALSVLLNRSEKGEVSIFKFLEILFNLEKYDTMNVDILKKESIFSN